MVNFNANLDVGVDGSAVHYQDRSRLSPLSQTIMALALIVFSFWAASALDRHEPGIAALLRLTAVTVSLVWLFSMIITSRRTHHYHDYDSHGAGVQVDVVHVHQPHRWYHSFWGSNSGWNWFNRQPLYQAPVYHHSNPPVHNVVRAPAQPVVNQPMYVAQPNRAQAYQAPANQPPRQTYHQGPVVPPVARASPPPVAKTMYVAPTDRPQAYQAPANFSGNLSRQPSFGLGGGVGFGGGAPQVFRGSPQTGIGKPMFEARK